ncbi:MAG: hypothetical protein DRP90_00620 [Planctomycetota bacterium]|nr:MAG: hypothetical protein DRP90_00620 [Planctomycetota bacterium]
MGRAAEYFSQEGRIAQELRGFEHRPQQVEMAEAVEAALAGGRTLLVEAGTGVGKSFAYLVPAALWALEGERRVVVSTYTINLQEQLIHKDIPFLAEKAGLRFTAALAKGRGNYICPRRLLAAVSRRRGFFEQFKPEDLHVLNRLENWFYREGDGTLSTLTFNVPERVWTNVRVEREACSGRRCSYFKSCPYFRDRAKWEAAQVLVVNHSLFFSDLALRLGDAPLLPAWDAVVFDEAHTLEDVAARHMGARLGRREALRTVRRVYDARTRRGFFADASFSDIHAAAAALERALEEYFAALGAFKEKGGWRVRTPGKFSARGVLSAGRELVDLLEQATASFGEDTEERQECLALCSRVKEALVAVDLFDSMSAEDFVYWVDGTPESPELTAVPVEVAGRLRQYLWSEEAPFVLTSATLATASGRGVDCSFVKERLGVDEAEEKVLGSPFDFRSQVKLYVPADVPDPTKDAAAYRRALVRYIREVVEVCGGGVFALFTNLKDMRYCHGMLAEGFEAKGLKVLAQDGSMPRNLMLDRFREDGSAVLFGVSSFWQGVDVKGDALRAVVIARLPFEVPSHPLVEARCEALAVRGMSAFRHYSLPGAILRLKQGFGRLVRAKRDEGMVVVLDPRLLTRNYGRDFLAALPPCPIVTAPSAIRERGEEEP